MKHTFLILILFNILSSNEIRQNTYTINGINFTINNSNKLDNNTISSLIIWNIDKNNNKNILENKLSYMLGNPNSFKYLNFKELDSNFVAIEEYTGGGSCCTYIHIYATKPHFKKIYTHNSDVIKFTGKNRILRYEDKDGIELSNHPLCCRPKIEKKST